MSLYVGDPLVFTPSHLPHAWSFTPVPPFGSVISDVNVVVVVVIISPEWLERRNDDVDVVVVVVS